MRRNSIFCTRLIFLFSILIYLTGPKEVLSGDGNGTDKPCFNEIREMRLAKNKIFNLRLDVDLGLNISSTNFNLSKVDSTNQSLNSTQTRTGPSAGVVLSIDFLGFGFTSGLQYASKGFVVTNGTNFNLNYFNIPLLFYFDFTISKVIIDGNVGPYLGLLLSQTSSPLYSVKNFDFGLTGNVQCAYMITKHIGPLLGLKYEYGGLNNLGSNENISSIRTSSFFIYTGVKFVL